ncbi:MBL fold metallo-hydrolase [Filimonas effusa]|uniref:MBL fold metallo-hydrolase n=1 Tax=Filimonas effusa TaxID=2508721 RepID=A0A4V1MAH2_9BACT|nr:MBL fold metallo-hydrolase [Filimonas effusa]RXK85866.1 MBL fold metallo-hydrolase [Filimonas effusa]
MIIEQMYTGCLAQGAYYIECDGVAAIIDPLREVQPYIDKASRNGASIKYILETHFHADFVSGHLDLAQKTGAAIVYGPEAAPQFNFYSAADGEELPLGKATITVIHTPGHTMESCCFLLKDETGKEIALFSGDTLFIGDVGRPDLAQKIRPELTPAVLAEHLYWSLRGKIMPLPDDVVVYPAHGAGSACGKNMCKETSDTLGHQKHTNYALRSNMTRDEFIREVMTGLVAPPAYFPFNVLMNMQGYESLDKVLGRGLRALSPSAFEIVANETTALILDTRDPASFAKGHIPNSINIGIDGSFAPWVGALIPDIKQEILVVAETGREQEVITRLARVGYDQAVGYLVGGYENWIRAGKEVEHVTSVTVAQLTVQAAQQTLSFIDVRKRSEYDSEHLPDALNMPLDNINEHMQQLNRNHTYYVHCAGGYRSMIFISILQARGFFNLINVEGGFKALKESGAFRITDFVKPVTQL